MVPLYCRRASEASVLTARKFLPDKVSDAGQGRLYCSAISPTWQARNRSGAINVQRHARASLKTPISQISGYCQREA